MCNASDDLDSILIMLAKTKRFQEEKRRKEEEEQKKHHAIAAE